MNLTLIKIQYNLVIKVSSPSKNYNWRKASTAAAEIKLRDFADMEGKQNSKNSCSDRLMLPEAGIFCE